MTEQQQFTKVWSIRLLLILAALLLIGKAFHLQVTSQKFRARANTAGTSLITEYPSRGLMADRNKKLLTLNQAAYQLELTYHIFKKESAQFDTLKFCKLLNISIDEFVEGVEKDWRSVQFSKYKPFVFMSNISQQQFATFQESLHEFPGFKAQLRSLRSYPLAGAGHLIGYMGEVSPEQIARDTLDFYRSGDYIGVSGLERQYEEVLRGKKGSRLILVDKMGREVEEASGNKINIPAEAGADLLTTIDFDLQAYGEQLMAGKMGSIIAIEPSTGEVLAMVSSPAYDPRLLSVGRQRSAAYNQLASDTLKPLLNRAIGGKYPPGSPFKTLVALIGLQEGTLHTDRGISCSGAFMSNGKRLTGCHGHPYCHNVEMAISQSCNTYFVTSFLELINRYGSVSPNKGLAEFNRYLYQFGLGVKTGIDFPGELEGNVPTPEYYTKRFAEDEFWRAIWIRSLGIGQGEYELTNLQMANLAAAIANRGYWITPHLVRGLRMGPDSVVAPPHQIFRHNIDIDKKHFETVANGMRQTFLSGTARRSEVPGLDLCGKTGTAENKGTDHSILFAFAPQHQPKIAISVYIEEGGFGSTYAAPIASLMIEKYINGEISEARKWMEKNMLEADLIGKSTAAK